MARQKKSDRFGGCVRRLDGSVVYIGEIRQNRERQLRFDPSFEELAEEPAGDAESESYLELEDIAFYNLKDFERRTARLAMRDGRPNGEIGEIEGVTREAIIARLNRMAAKNECVRMWQRRKNKKNQYE